MLSYNDLISKIYEDEKIEDILEALGCHSIKLEQRGSLITCARPDGKNTRSVQVRNDYGLKSKIRTRGVSGNIIDIVKYIKEFEYACDARLWIMNVCGYGEDTSYEEPPLLWLNKIKRQRRYYDFDYELPILDEEVLNEYCYGDIFQFMNDGISKDALDKFKIGYDSLTKRITIPVYDIDGNLCGVKGRATEKDEEEYLKFWYLYPCDQSKTLYNYHKVKNIVPLLEVNVFEAEKSPMQMDDIGIFNCVGIGSSNISRNQLQLLFNLNCDIILCPDKGLDIDKFLEPYILFFKCKRNVYLILDENDLLPSKASPSDCGIEIWNELYQMKIQICKEES